MPTYPDIATARQNLRHVDNPASRFKADLRYNPDHPNHMQEIRSHGFLGFGGTTGTEAAYNQQGGDQHPYYTLTAADRNLLNADQSVELKANPFAVVPARQAGTLRFPPQTTIRNATGTAPFVIMLDGTCRLGAPLRIGAGIRYNHCYIANRVVQVAFAGEITFRLGKLDYWTNASGGYRCSTHDATRVGLRLDRFRPSTDDQPRPVERKPDYVISGVRSQVNWGSKGAPPAITNREPLLWWR